MVVVVVLLLILVVVKKHILTCWHCASFLKFSSVAKTRYPWVTLCRDKKITPPAHCPLSIHGHVFECVGDGRH